MGCKKPNVSWYSQLDQLSNWIGLPTGMEVKMRVIGEKVYLKIHMDNWFPDGWGEGVYFRMENVK
jgi:hypothetical protein